MNLSVNNLTKAFGSVKALDDVSFSLGSGEVFGFIGPNGAGKTTAMRIIATLCQPDAGEVLIGNTSLLDYPECARKNIGFMPDTLPDNRDTLVWEYLDFFIRCAGVTGKERIMRRERLEEFTQLLELTDKRLNELSKGMKQRVSLARALTHDPAILILDEPAAGLDPRARVELREIIKNLAGNGKTILISSHILSDLEDICNGAIIIERGKILRSGKMKDLISSAPAGLPVMRISCSDNAAAMELLKTFPPAEAVENHGETLLVRLKGSEEDSMQIIALLTGAKITVRSFAMQNGTLEDAFMKITTGKVQ